MNKLFIVTLATFTIAIIASERGSATVPPKRQKSRKEGGLIFVPGTRQIVPLHDGFELALPGDKFPNPAAVNAFKASIRRAIRDTRIEKQIHMMVAYSFHYHKRSFCINNVVEDYNKGITDYSLKDTFQKLHEILAEDAFKLATAGEPIPDYVIECLAASDIDLGRRYRSPFSGRPMDLALRGPRIDSGEATDEESPQSTDGLPAYQDVVRRAAEKSQTGAAAKE